MFIIYFCIFFSGAFLIPYIIMLFIEGVPIFYLELAIGQRLRKGAVGLWREVSPYMGGIGIAMAVVSFNVALYYNTIIAWCLFYFFQSFQSPLPWADCPKEHYSNNNSYLEVAECSKSSPTQYFWYRKALDISSDINHSQGFNWRMALCLLIAWALCYMCMIKGIASSGKWNKLSDPVVWLEAGTQIFFSMGLAFGGLIAFSSYNPVHNNCFRDAITLSLTNCFTAMFAAIVVFSVLGFKAHMKNEECLKGIDEILLLLYNSTEVTPAPAGSQMIPFGSSVPITMPPMPVCDIKQDLAKSASGTGLAFIAFTEAINQFPWAPVWAVLFFLMLFTLGIDSQFGTLEGAVTSIVDMKLFPNLRKEILTGCICLVSFLLSLIFAHGAGSYVFTIFDDFAGNIPLLVIAFFECICVMYIYGGKRFADDIELMTGSRPSLYWLFCWKYVSPLAMLCILISSLVKIAENGSIYEVWVASEGSTTAKEWPIWANVVIAFLILLSVLWIPGIAIAQAFGVSIFGDDTPAWFPADELREFYNIEPHKVTTCERWFFCMKDEDPEDEV
uniref:Transporter n=1 Tax=Strigamia maritima TaxID=126957 RepID=T1J242_STRMM